MIAAEARAHYGVALAPGRAEKLAIEVGGMIAAADRAASRLAFEDEPSAFPRAMREQAR
jgi:hypothetical protein